MNSDDNDLCVKKLVEALKLIAELKKSLEYAIEEADKWYDNDCGGPVNTGVNTPEMDAARELLAQKREKPDFDGVCLPASQWPAVLLAAEIGPENMPTFFRNHVKNGFDIFNLKGLYECGTFAVPKPE